MLYEVAKPLITDLVDATLRDLPGRTKITEAQRTAIIERWSRRLPGWYPYAFINSLRSFKCRK